jgi:hypothetical protein
MGFTNGEYLMSSANFRDAYTYGSNKSHTPEPLMRMRTPDEKFRRTEIGARAACKDASGGNSEVLECIQEFREISCLYLKKMAVALSDILGC